jgi:hypothetical protein
VNSVVPVCMESRKPALWAPITVPKTGLPQLGAGNRTILLARCVHLDAQSRAGVQGNVGFLAAAAGEHKVGGGASSVVESK